jgi:hypothetical protein
MVESIGEVDIYQAVGFSHTDFPFPGSGPIVAECYPYPIRDVASFEPAAPQNAAMASARAREALVFQQWCV